MENKYLVADPFHCARISSTTIHNSQGLGTVYFMKYRRIFSLQKYADFQSTFRVLTNSNGWGVFNDIYTFIHFRSNKILKCRQTKWSNHIDMSIFIYDRLVGCVLCNIFIAAIKLLKTSFNFNAPHRGMEREGKSICSKRNIIKCVYIHKCVEPNINTNSVYPTIDMEIAFAMGNRTIAFGIDMEYPAFTIQPFVNQFHTTLCVAS